MDFAEPRHVTDVASCHFYHTIDLPVSGLQHGDWDLRQGLDQYLPSLDFQGATVLDVGTGTGALAFEFERRGADVIALDTGLDRPRDLIPWHDLDQEAMWAAARPQVEATRNAFWLSHRELGSSVRVAYGHANELPGTAGPVDVAFFGNILQHLGDPFGALAGVAGNARRIVVTEAIWRPDLDDEPVLFWLASLRDDAPVAERAPAWWQVNAEMLSRWLEVLGYRIEQRYDHHQLYAASGDQIPHYTVVGTR